MKDYRIYQCPKDCTVSDHPGRCPRCNKWLLKRHKSMTHQEAKDETMDRQQQSNR